MQCNSNYCDQSLDKVNGEHDHLPNPAEKMQRKFREKSKKQFQVNQHCHPRKEVNNILCISLIN